VVDTFNVLSTWADVVVIDCADVCAAALSLEFSTLDLARRLALPFVHVVGLQPGCVPEALHRVQTIVHGGLECAGWIANGLGPSTDSSEDLIRALGRAMPGSCLGTIPHLRPVAPERAAQTIDMRRSLGVLAA
jgi:dethiobiotin synthetase